MNMPRIEFARSVKSSEIIITTAYLTFNTKNRYELVKITPILEEIVAKSGVAEGICFVSPMHITSSIFVNDDESGLHEDFLNWLEKLAPYNPKGYKHNLTGEDNADAHLKRTIMGRETIIAITNGRLDLGPWEEVFYGEFDGQRPKRVIVKVIGAGT
ncbi:MAG: secondary thiamine-phosphate synthase enzyme YjbQ [Actinobacteria bacterium]|nr:secondary thiamine-phosphate synthase enzyme YjbQ [Actinomycetota bacterium]